MNSDHPLPPRRPSERRRASAHVSAAEPADQVLPSPTSTPTGQFPADAAAPTNITATIPAASRQPTHVAAPPDYQKLFDIKAVVDWLEVTVHLPDTSNFMRVKRITRALKVDPIDKGPGGAATRFAVRFADPERWSDVECRIARLREKFGFVDAPRVTRIEVSLDAYSHAQDAHELGEMVQRMLRMRSEPVSDNTRITNGVFTDNAEHIPHIAYRAKEGWTINVGSKADPLSMRIYLKRIDNKVQLPVEKHRARMEITLQGERAAALGTLDQAESFEFQKLARFFRRRRFKTEDLAALTDGARMAIARDPAPGVRGKGKDGRLFPKITPADRVWNDIVFSRLRLLTERMSGTRRTRKSAPASSLSR